MFFTCFIVFFLKYKTKIYEKKFIIFSYKKNLNDSLFNVLIVSLLSDFGDGKI
jgi:hypothetical protein